MFIRVVKIQGFKTYKDETVLEFSPDHNVIRKFELNSPPN